MKQIQRVILFVLLSLTCAGVQAQTRITQLSQEQTSASTAAWTSATSSDTALSLTVTNFSQVILSFNPSGSITGGTLNFEVSDDGGTTWYATMGARVDSFTSEGTFALNGATKKMWCFDVRGVTTFRVRLNPVITSTGTANLRVQAQAGAGSMGIVVGQSTAANLNATVTGTVATTQSGTWTVQPGNTANTTAWLVTGTGGTFPAMQSGNWSVRAQDGAGNALTSNSTTTSSKFGLDTNILSILGTAPTTAGKLDVKGADGDVFVRQTTASNLNATVVGTGTFAVQPAGSVAHDGVATSSNPNLIGGYASAAAPTDVSADGDAVRAWMLRSGATVVQPSYAGVLQTTGNGASGTGVPRVTIANDSTGVIQLVPGTAGGLLISRTLSAASTNATSVKASAGQIYAIYVINTNASVRYLKIYNKASSPTVGTDTPVLTFPISGSTTGGGFVFSTDVGIAFGTGIAFALTTGVADADTVAVAANEIVVNILYK